MNGRQLVAALAIAGALATVPLEAQTSRGFAARLFPGPEPSRTARALALELAPEETLLWSASLEADKAAGSLTPDVFFGYNTAAEKDKIEVGFSHSENPSANTFSLQGKHFFVKSDSFSFLVNGSYQDTRQQESILKGGLVASWTSGAWSIVPSVSGGRKAVHGSDSVSDVVPSLEIDYDLTDEVSLAASYTFHNRLDGSYYYEVDLSYQPIKERKHLSVLVGAGKDSFATVRVDLRF